MYIIISQIYFLSQRFRRKLRDQSEYINMIGFEGGAKPHPLYFFEIYFRHIVLCFRVYPFLQFYIFNIIFVCFGAKRKKNFVSTRKSASEKSTTVISGCSFYIDLVKHYTNFMRLCHVCIFYF